MEEPFGTCDICKEDVHVGVSPSPENLIAEMDYEERSEGRTESGTMKVYKGESIVMGHGNLAHKRCLNDCGMEQFGSSSGS